MHNRIRADLIRISCLLCGLAAVATAQADEPSAHWLEQPCALMETDDLARVLPTAADSMTSAPYVGRRSSECTWTEPGTDRSLRLVLHPARDAERVTAQLQRLFDADAAAVAFDVDAAPAFVSADRTQLSLGVDHWMISVFGSEPLDADGLHALAAALVQRVGRPSVAE